MAAQSLSGPPYQTPIADKSGTLVYIWMQWFQSVFRTLNQLDSGLNQGRQL